MRDEDGTLKRWRSRIQYMPLPAYMGVWTVSEHTDHRPQLNQGGMKGEGALTSSRLAQTFLTDFSLKFQIPNRQVIALAACTCCYHIRKYQVVRLPNFRRPAWQIDIVRILWCEFYFHLSIINPRIFSCCAYTQMQSPRTFYSLKRICTIFLYSHFNMIYCIQQIWCRCAREMKIF